MKAERTDHMKLRLRNNLDNNTNLDNERTTSMSKLLRIAKPAVLGLLLAAGSFTAAVGGLSTTTTFASQPTQINAFGMGGSARVWGSYFTPNTIERVQLIDSSSHVQATAFTRILWNGQLGAVQMPTTYTGSVSVVASKYSCIRFANRPFCRYWTQATTSTTIYASPHLDSVFGEAYSVTVWGSGFTPGGRVQIKVFDAGYHLLDTIYDVADNSNSIYRGDISGDWLHTGSYYGKVYVVAYDYGHPHKSNWASTIVVR
jgi:hypothetical protein